MGKQVWGTFSVKDHCDPSAFVAEVMLYDRLVIPIPPDAGERARWESERWNPARLDTILEILGDRAYPVTWDASRQTSWRNRYEAGKSVAARIPASGPWLEVNRGGRYPFLKVSHGFEDHSLRHHLRSAPILPAALRTARSHVPHCPSSISSRNVFAQRRLGEPLVVCAMVGALIFLARPNWPMIQIP